MKKLMIGTALLVLGVSAQAQEVQRKTSGERAEMRTERMTKDLGLNAEQAEQVKAINARYAEKHEAIRAEHKARAEANKSQRSEMHEARMADYKAVLTPEQYEKLVAQQAAMKEKHLEKRKEMRKEKRPEMRDAK